MAESQRKFVVIQAKYAKSGDVEVYACCDGCDENGKYTAEVKRFIVPLGEFTDEHRRSEAEFVIDEKRHKMVDSFDTW